MLRKILRILNDEGVKGFYQRLRIRFLYIIKPNITPKIGIR